MTDGGQDFNLGHVVGATGQTGPSGADGLTVWNTSTAPAYANSKYTFTISNLNGKTGLNVAVNDIIFYDTYYYIISAVNSTTVDCTTRVSIKGSDASVTIQTSWGSTLSDSKVPSEKLVKNSLPTKLSDLTNDSDFIETSSTSGLVKNDGSIDTSSYLTQLKIGTTSGLPVKTGSSGVLEAGAFGTSAGQFAEGNHTHSGMLTSSDIVDNLTTNDNTKVLSAKQGKALYDLIAGIENDMLS